MKKVLALMLALVLVLSLVACGGGNSSSVESQEKTKTEITSDSMIGEWVVRADTDSNNNHCGLAIQLRKGGTAKWSFDSSHPDWSTIDSRIKWELNDGVIVITGMLSGGQEYYETFEIIDENTIKNIDSGAVFNKE